MEIRLRKKVAFAAITQVAILATVESTLRATGFRRPTNPVEFVGANLGADKFREWDDTVFWRMRPHAEIPGCSERLNERGFRGPDRSVAKVAGVKRIVCLGDSCTFGSMVGGTVTFSHVLERWIVDHGGSVEVVNLGVPGYSALQILRQLRSVALPLTPDVVVVYAGAWNDFTPAIRFDDRTIAAQVDAQSRSWSALSMGSLRIVDGCRAIVASNHVVAASTAETFAMGFALRHELPDGPRMPCAPFRETLAEISR
ncbi:MAG TPA: SGNH/GDSL hydrolase family protein, partial [Planctomycetota bacterium]|nr:SGNH/GDSL hydrolase family protein [Planctomycetota bacterium]